ncbi:unnamed protein product, partial [Effrenium voratum]
DSFESGHYVCHVPVEGGAKWLSYDDANVCARKKLRLNERQCRLVFYEVMSAAEPPLPAVKEERLGDQPASHVVKQEETRAEEAVPVQAEADRAVLPAPSNHVAQLQPRVKEERPGKPAALVVIDLEAQEDQGATPDMGQSRVPTRAKLDRDGTPARSRVVKEERPGKGAPAVLEVVSLEEDAEEERDEPCAGQAEAVQQMADPCPSREVADAAAAVPETAVPQESLRRLQHMPPGSGQDALERDARLLLDVFVRTGSSKECNAVLQGLPDFQTQDEAVPVNVAASAWHAELADLCEDNVNGADVVFFL